LFIENENQKIIHFYFWGAQLRSNIDVRNIKITAITKLNFIIVRIIIDPNENRFIYDRNNLSINKQLPTD
jgi:hypothetical protein